MMNILPNDLKRQYMLHATEYEEKALEVLRSGWYILGKEVAAFEEEFATAVGARYCVGLASGLDALWLATTLLDIGAGDEVIVAANAYIACVMGITIPGALPVFVEPDEYYNIDVARIEAAITPNTKAIMPVHLYGQTCNMTQLMDLAKKHSLYVIEDCAQSHLSQFDGKTAGTFGDVGCFSFYPTKGNGAFGDAGAVVTNNEALAEKFRMWRNYGSREQYKFEVVGANSRLDELQAGLLRIKLAYLDEMNRERESIAARYLEEIKNPLVVLPKVHPQAYTTWHQFVIRSSKRDALRQYLADAGIGTIIHYPIPPHLSQAYHYLGHKVGDFPLAEQYAQEVLSLPIYNGMKQSEQAYVIDSINAFMKP